MRMTFAEWIREQKDICDKLKEQNYEDQKEIRNFLTIGLNGFLKQIYLKIKVMKEFGETIGTKIKECTKPYTES